MFGIWCTVTGGVTGTREAWMKEDGKIKLYDTEAEAAERARRLMDVLSTSSAARFSYVAKQYQ